MASPLPKVVPARPAHGHRRAGDDYGVSDQPDWRGDRLDRPPAPHPRRGRRGQLRGHRLRRRAPDRVHPRPRRPVAELAREHPPLRPGPARDRARPARLRPVADARREDHRSSSTAAWSPTCATQLGLGPCVVVGNSMGGYIASELAIKRPELVERLMLVSAAGVSQMDVAKRPVMAVTKAVGLVTAMSVAQLPAVARRPRSRHWALLLVARHPSRLAADFAYEGLMKGTGKPGFVDAMRGLPGVRPARQPAQHRLPHPGRLGRQGHDHPGRGRRQVHRADQGLAQADHGGHRPRVDGRAAGHLQRPPAGVPGLRRSPRASSRASSAGKRALGAEPTSLAYLASTPCVYSGSGDS